MENLTPMFEAIDSKNEGMICFSDFANFLEKPINPMCKEKYLDALFAFKAARHIHNRTILKQFQQFSDSFLYSPSFFAKLHTLYKCLPSESFENISSLTDAEATRKLVPNISPARQVQNIPTYMAGYITLHYAKGIPLFPLKEDIISRKVNVGFFNTTKKEFAFGSTFVEAEASQNAEDVWYFNKPDGIGTNPLAFKWITKEEIKDIIVVFELVLTLKYTLKYNTKIIEVIKKFQMDGPV